MAEFENEKFNYNKHVKKNLRKWRDDFEIEYCSRLNYSAIAQKMQDDFGITTSPQKISAMFETEIEPAASREVKLQELVALSQMFNIPLQNIYEYPNAVAYSDIECSSLLKPNKKNGHSSVNQLSNRFYIGNYYCYYFKAKHYDDQLTPIETSTIEEAKMTISIENGHSVVTLQEMKTNKTFNGELMPSFTLTGKLYLFENTNIAYSFIRDASGRRAMALMFTYINLSADIRYYMTVAVMTFSLNQTHSPLFQKMAVFKEQQDYSNAKTEEILRGILALNTSPLVIEKKTLENLIEQDETLKELVSSEKALKECYVFSESSIRSNAFCITDNNEKTQKMLCLRKNSLLPAREIVSEPDYFADFIRQYQIEHRKDANR